LGKGFHTITSFHKTQLYVHQFEDRKRSRSSTTSTSIPRYVVPLLSRIPRCFPSSEEQQKQRTATAAAGSILLLDAGRFPVVGDDGACLYRCFCTRFTGLNAYHSKDCSSGRLNISTDC